MDVLSQLFDTAKPYIAPVALAFTWAGVALAWWRRKQQFRRKEFLSQVNFSLNLFGDTLQMRTLAERFANDVWPNAHGVALLNRAAKRATDENPFLVLTSADDQGYVYRAIKNALSQLCPEAFVAAAVGAPVRTGPFLFALTCERYEEGMRTIKLRVILIEREALREWCAPGGKGEQLALAAFYRTRLKTLQAMYEMDRKHREGTGPELLGRVELGVATS
jgi:hypothetical protein